MRSLATVHFASPQTEMPRMRSNEPRKYRKAALLPFVEALINGSQRVGEALQSSPTHT